MKAHPSSTGTGAQGKRDYRYRYRMMRSVVFKVFTVTGDLLANICWPTNKKARCAFKKKKRLVIPQLYRDHPY